MFDEFLWAVPRIEEVDVPADTYHVSFVDESFGVVNLRLGFRLYEKEAKRVGGFLVGVLAEDEALAPNDVIFGVVVEPASIREVVTSSVSDEIIDNDDSVL